MRLATAIVAVSLLATLAFSGAASARGGADTILVTKTSAGDPVSGENASVSDSGRYVAFEADDDSLPGTAGRYDIYVRDTEAGTTTQVNVTSAGVPANGGGFYPAISGSGRYVTFESWSTNMPGGGNALEIYVHDLETGETTLVSKTGAGTPADGLNEDPSISDSGRYIAYNSSASNLPGAPHKERIYVYDMDTGKVRLASLASNGDLAKGQCNVPEISGTGRYVAFRGKAHNLPGRKGINGIYRHDMKSGETRLVSRSSRGKPSNSFNDSPTISDSGRYVGFDTAATNLGGHRYVADAYVRDLKKRKTQLVDRTSKGAAANYGNSYRPWISDSGRYVLFDSLATNLPGANGISQVYLRDLKTGKTALISRTTSGEAATGQGNYGEAISGPGDYAVFGSSAPEDPYVDGVFGVYQRGPLH